MAGLQGRAWAAVSCGSVPGAAPSPVLKMKAPVNVAKPAGQLLQNMSCPAAVCLVPTFFAGAVLSSQDSRCCCLVLLHRSFGRCTSYTFTDTRAHASASPLLRSFIAASRLAQHVWSQGAAVAWAATLHALVLCRSFAWAWSGNRRLCATSGRATVMQRRVCRPTRPHVGWLVVLY